MGWVCSGRGMSEPRVRCGCLCAWGGPGWLGEAWSHRQCGLQGAYFLSGRLWGLGKVVLHKVKNLIFRARQTWLGVSALPFSSCHLG